MTNLVKDQFKNHRFFCVILVLLACFYFILVGHYSPSSSGDSTAYLAYSELIIKSISTDNYLWMKELNLAGGSESWSEWQWSKPSTYRMIGYPLVIVGAKFLGGENFGVLLQIFQSFSTLITIVFVYIALLEVVKNKEWATIGVLAYALSPVIYLQNTILTDSLYSNLLTIAYCLSIISLYRDSGFYQRCLLIGLSLAVTFLIKDVTAIIIIIFIPIFLLPIWYSKLPQLKKLISALLIFIPLCSAYLGYGLWNYSRAGAFFMTLNHPPYTLFTQLREGVPVFSYGEPIDIAANKTIREFNILNKLPEGRPPPFLIADSGQFIGRFFELMETNFGYDQRDMFIAISGRAKQLLIDYPIQSIKFAFGEMFLGNPNGFPPVMGMALSPFTELAMLEQMKNKGNGRSIMSVVRNIQSGNFEMIDVIECVVRIVFRLIPLSIFLLYLAFVPIWLIYLRKESNTNILIVISFWIVFAGMTCVYSLFHFEVRYVLGALLSQILCAILSAQFLILTLYNKYKQQSY
jgi:hypothetical protein